MKRMNCSGVTIVELVIVLAVMSITFATVYPRMTDYLERKTLDGTVQVLTYDLLLARQQAVSKGNNFVLSFYTDQNSYLIFDDENHNNQPDADENILGPRGLSSGISILDMTFENSRVVFQPTGKATSGKVVIANCDSVIREVQVYRTGAVHNDL
jgi:prepilin-type N-terminal cleavage/methylation domain-containing protein